MSTVVNDTITGGQTNEIIILLIILRTEPHIIMQVNVRVKTARLKITY